MEVSRRAFIETATIALVGFKMPGLDSLVMANEAAPDLGDLTVPTGKRYPGIPFGIQSGDIHGGSAVIWSASDREGARMKVRYSTRSDFRESELVSGPRAEAKNGFATKVQLDNLPRGQQLFYQVYYESPDRAGNKSPALTGTFRTPAKEHQACSFILSGDTAGQNYGINPDFGGMPMYRVMAAHNPDLFIHLGDNIYADGPITEKSELPDGRVWKNITTEGTSKVAETLAEFRANWQYNLLDPNVLRFNRTIPIISCWDDHEVLNNWDPAQKIDDARYTEKDIKVLASRGRKAYLEWTPTMVERAEQPTSYRKFSYGPEVDIFRMDLRSYRGSNAIGDGSEAAILGKTQSDWLMKSLKESTATWKIMACDMPIGLVIPDSGDFDGIANSNGPARGREIEVARVLKFIKDQGITNVVFFTADVHYAAAHRYTPEKAEFKDFNPFYEFVSGPISAVTGSAKELDSTFGPEVLFLSRKAGLPDLSPLDGCQYFTRVEITKDKKMIVELRNLADEKLYVKELQPERMK